MHTFLAYFFHTHAYKQIYIYVYFSDIILPEGVDPSFLAALPDSIRQEVIDEQMRLQRIQQRAQQDVQQLGVQEVNPEFLAALPPNIQEEVCIS